MGNAKKTAAFLLSLILVFSLVLNPFFEAYANVPIIKPPVINAPAVKPPIISPLRRLETPARVQGVSYEFKDEVKRIPASMKYDFEPLTLDKFASFELEAKSPSVQARKGIDLSNTGMPGAETTEPATAAQDENALTFDKVNGIKYPAGSKILAVPKSVAASFAPKTNEIYIDEEMGTAFRVLDAQNADAEGNHQYVVETPELTDVFKSYTIPEQTIDLTTGNIAYIAPEFELNPDSGMPKDYVASAGISDLINFKQEGNKHIITFKPGITVFEYPFKEEEKEKPKKEKFEGEWWEKDQSGDLRGVENESSLKVNVKVKEGTITVEDPKFHSYFDLNPLTSHVVADFYFDAKATADVTLEGDITFNKTIEKCVYGYEIDLGKVLGGEKGNKAFVGIFIVIGVEGKIHVEVRTITTGDARAGFAYKAFGYGGIPYFVGPYATYRPASFDMSFTVDGEINSKLACVPQVGVIIWGKELGVLQIWVGFKSKAVFSASGGGGTNGAQDFNASGSITLDAFGELVGYLLGSRYSIFYIDYPLYKGEWSIGVEASGSGGDAVREVIPHFRVTADAYTDTIEGKVLFDTANKSETGYAGEDSDIESGKKPYANGRYELEVWDGSGVKYRIPGLTNAEGSFTVKDPARYSIRPTDRVIVKIENSPVFEIEQIKYKVVGNSKEIRATVPFSQSDINLDAFNDVITGWVSGNYTGPVKVTVFDDNKNNGFYINAVNGIFKFEYPIDESTLWAFAGVEFEGSQFPAFPPLRYPSLDALTLNFYNDFSQQSETTNNNIGSSLINSRRINIIDRGISLPDSIPNIQDHTAEMTGEDIEGNKFIRPTKIFGTITNKGDMGWIQSQGDEYVRTGTNNGNLRYFEGNVKITEISVQSALEAMMEDLKGPHDNWIPKPLGRPAWTATVQARQAMELKQESENSSPVEIPTSAARFEFNQPKVCAYKIEIEHEGRTLEKIYNPYAYHYNNNQQSLEDFIGPLREALTLVTEEKIDSVVNPADVMNQWNAAWLTQIGRMELTQNGNMVEGSITQGETSFPVQGTVTDGVFKGSYMVPSESLFGSDIVTFEMEISPDGKSINFRNIGSDTRLKGLNGTRAIKQ